MSTENKPESPKEGEEKNWLYEQYNLTHEQTKDNEISLLYTKWNEATEEIQSIRDQLVEKERDRAIYANAVNYLKATLTAKEEEIRKLKEVMKELIPIAESRLNYPGEARVHLLKKEAINRAKELLTPNP